MEITNEIKAKVYAQYLGCKWATSNSEGELNYYTLQFYKDCKYKLVLKPLSSITDEDAIELHKLHFNTKDPSPESLSSFKKSPILNYLFESGSLNLKSYQFLQSKGYDLPQYLLGGKTLKEAGLAIYL